MILKIPYRSPKAIVLADQVVVSGTSFLSNMLLAHELGLQDFGIFSMVILVQLFVLSLQQASSSGIYQVLLGRFTGNKQIFYTNGLFYLQVIFFLMLLIAGSIASSFFHNNFFIPAVIASVLFLFQDFLRKVLITNKKELQAFISDVITNGLQLSLFVVCIYTIKISLTITFWIMGLTFIPSLITGIFWLRPGAFKISAVKFAWNQHTKHSGWMLLSALLQWFAGNFFVVAAGWWLGLAALGALRLAQYIFGLLNVVLQAIENYALPRGASLQDNEMLFKNFLFNIFKKTALLFAPVLVLLSVFAAYLLKLAGGNSYTAYAYVMYGLSLVYVVIIMGLPVRVALRVQLLNKNYFIGYLLATIFSLITAKWLITQWQLAGVLTGLFFTQVIVVTYWMLILKRKKVLVWKLSI